jgi:3-methylfumaryl-CoA hydratase
MREFDSWIGRTKADCDILALPLVQRLAAALDRDASEFRQRDALPRGWHAVLFSPLAKSCDLDVDGHARRGDFLPPIPLPRRLFAGRRVKFERELIIGDEVTRSAEITGIRQVEGKSGLLVFVTARYTLSGSDGLAAIIEEQEVVYREETSKGASRSVDPHDAPLWSVPVSFDPTSLFRFSAAVFNAHRIHFDVDYTRDVEGYNGLVANASLLTLHMFRHAEQAQSAAITNVEVRNRALVLASDPIEIRGCSIEGKIVIQTVQNGQLCAEMYVN